MTVESVVSSACYKSRKGMLPVIWPDHSKGDSPMFCTLHATGVIEIDVGLRFTVYVFQ